MTQCSLYYATNRRHRGKDRWHPSSYGPEASRDGTENLRFGRVDVEYDSATVAGLLRAPSGFGEGNGEKLAKYLYSQRRIASIDAFEELLDVHRADVDQDRKRFGSSRTFGELQKMMRAGCDTLVYIHGFNVSWWEAVAAATSLQMMLNRNPGQREIRVVLFTWPSDGRAIPYWSYFSDRSDATFSGAAVGRALLKLRDFLIDARREDVRKNREPCRRSVHLLSHSMGNFVLQHALARVEQFSSNCKPPRLFDQVFLCAPDVADNVFEPEHPMRRLPEMAEQVTVYHNRGDLAMPVSDYTKGNTDRLGWGGANRPSELDGRVHQVDCSPIVTGFVEHSYYLAGRVNDDLRQSLNKIDPDDPDRMREAVRHGWPNVWRMK
jgi:esterase/lipase superfamily enzyme